MLTSPCAVVQRLDFGPVRLAHAPQVFQPLLIRRHAAIITLLIRFSFPGKIGRTRRLENGNGA